jgi:AcrR family transcriptional regulator
MPLWQKMPRNGKTVKLANYWDSSERGERVMGQGLTERNKSRTRRELAEAASRLFLERGYSSTTVQDIVDAVDISPRTFFRYFPCKEDVVTAIASLSMDDSIDHLAEHDPTEPIGQVLRAMMRTSLSRVCEDPVSARAFQVMLRDTPTLRGRWLEEQRRNRDRLAEAVRPWFAPDSHPLVRHLVAGAALLAVDEVMACWADDATNPDVVEMLDEAFDVLENSLFEEVAPARPGPPKAKTPE